MTVAHAIAQILKQEGTEHLIAYPVNPLIEAAAEADIRTVIVRQERTGLHMADAMSRLSSGDQPGVFCMQFGPGAENAFGGVAQCYGESSPVLVIPSGYPRRQAHVQPNFNSVLNFQHVTKSCEPLELPKATGDVFRRAFSQMKNGRPGPALIEVPLDLFDQEAPDQRGYQPALKARYGPDPAEVSRVATMLLEAENPVLYAGQGVHYAKAWPELLQLAEKLQIPVTTSLGGKSAFPETHPLSLGCGGLAMGKPVHQFLSEADLVLGIGCSFTTTFFGIYMPRYKQAKFIHATLDPADVSKDLVPECALIGDAQLTLRGLLDEISDASPTQLSRAKRRSIEAPARIAAVREEWLAEWAAKRTKDTAPLSPYRVLGDLHDVVAESVGLDQVIITHDAGSPRDQLAPFWQSTTPLSYLGWGKTTQLGYGLGLAMGAKLVQPDKLCINVWGDAAIGFTGMDFETAVRERLPILSILLNNFCMAIELPIMQVATEKYRSTDISGNYAEMAKAFGGYGERVTDPSQIAAAIKRGIAATQEGTPALLEFITEQENQISRY